MGNNFCAYSVSAPGETTGRFHHAHGGIAQNKDDDVAQRRSQENKLVGISYLVIKDEPAGCFSLFRDQQFIYVCYLQTIAGCLVRI